MSYSVEWIEPVYNRNNFSVINAEKHRYLSDTRGWFNYTDLNRIENNTIYVKEYMLDLGIIKSSPVMTHKTDWQLGENVTSVDTARIIENIKILMELSNPEIIDKLLAVTSSSIIPYQTANALEYNLSIMATQPEIPVILYKIELEQGIIEETGTNTGEFEADTIIHISGLSDRENSIDEYCMAFNYWSGDKNDLQYLGDVNAQSTTFICQHHDIKLSANFKSSKLIKIIIEDGYIYGDNESEALVYTIGTFKGIESIHNPVQYIAHEGDILDIAYAPTTKTDYRTSTKVNTSEFGVVTVDNESLTHYANERFIGWEFYAEEPFFEDLCELDKNDILLDSCDTASTTILVPNVNTLIIRPKFVRIPASIKFQRRRPSGNMGTSTYYAVNFDGHVTGQFTADNDGAYENLGYTFDGWMICYGDNDELIQSEALVEFIEKINTPDATTGVPPTTIEINFTYDMFYDYDGPDTINVYAVWNPAGTSSTGMCNIKTFSAPLTKTSSNEDYVATSVLCDGKTIKELNYRDIYHYQQIGSNYHRYVLTNNYSKYSMNYTGAVRFSYTLGVSSSKYKQYTLYLPINSDVICLAFPQMILKNRWNYDSDSNSIYESSSYITNVNFLDDVCISTGQYVPSFHLDYEIVDSNKSYDNASILNSPKRLIFIKTGSTKTLTSTECCVGFNYTSASTVNYNMQISYGLHTRLFEKGSIKWGQPVYIEPDKLTDSGFVYWEKTIVDDLEDPDTTGSMKTTYDIIASNGDIQLNTMYIEGYNSDLKNYYLLLKVFTEPLTQVVVTDGEIIDYAEWSYYPADSNYQQCHIKIGASSANIPYGAYMTLKPLQKYQYGFTHWTVTYTVEDGTVYTEDVTDNYVYTGCRSANGTTNGLVCSNIEITAVYTEDIDYAIVTLNGCYIAYCDKNYVYDNPRSARVEKGSKLVVFPKGTCVASMEWGNSARDTFVLTVNYDMTIDVNRTGDNRYLQFYTDVDNVTLSCLYKDYHKIPSWYDLPSRKLLAAAPIEWNLSSEETSGFTAYPLPKYMKLHRYICFLDSRSLITSLYTDMLRVYAEATIAKPDLELYNEDMDFICAVYNSSGDITTYSKKYEEQLVIEADAAPEGYEFYKWDGDIQYIEDEYSSTIDILMPAENFTLRMLYKPQDYDIISYVKLHEGKIKLEDGTFVSDGEFVEGTILTIVSDDVPEHWEFYRWAGEADSMNVVEDVYASETTLEVKDFDIELTREIMEHAKWSLSITNGEISGSYYENDLVAIYFTPPDGVTTYKFTGWTGDTEGLLLEDGSAFDSTNPGTPDDPQIIVMPAEDINIIGGWELPYNLTVTNGTGSGAYNEGDIVEISFTPPDGVTTYKFTGWTGDTEGLLLEDGSAFDSTAENAQRVVIPASDITLIGEYKVPHTFTVTNGETSGSYYEGDLVPIYFVPVETNPNKLRFSYWYVYPYELVLEDGSSFDRYTAGTLEEPQLVVMPDEDVSITARCKTARTLTVTNGETSGTFYYEDLVDIYFVPPEGVEYYQFDGWGYSYANIYLADGSAFDFSNGELQTIKMPDTSFSLLGTYTQLYSLEVINGSGTGIYKLNDTITVEALIPDGQTFVEWTGDIDYLTDPTSSNTTVVMPAENITITAVFEATSE